MSAAHAKAGAVGILGLQAGEDVKGLDCTSCAHNNADAHRKSMPRLGSALQIAYNLRQALKL